jgi:HAD superfamily hydrolase (TIGR01549 family)
VSEQPDVVIFDFDGTLVDSDDALLAPFDRLGIARSAVVMGSAVAEECARLGVSMQEYVDAYDTQSVAPFEGVPAMLERIPRWAILSNKHPAPARVELERLGWEPELVMCADAFDWEHKALEPMLDALGVAVDQVVLVGDSDGDLRCADEVGCRFIWAGWNERVQQRRPDGEVAATPTDLPSLLGLD